MAAIGILTHIGTYMRLLLLLSTATYTAGVPVRVGEVTADADDIEKFWWQHRPHLNRPPAPARASAPADDTQ